MDIDDAKTEMYLDDLQNFINDTKNMKIDSTFEQPIVEMNLKLREDLTKAFECYITLLSKCDRLQQDKIKYLLFNNPQQIEPGIIKVKRRQWIKDH